MMILEYFKGSIVLKELPQKIVISGLFLIMLLSLLPILALTARAETLNRIDLTDEEQAWLQEHPVIRVANEMDWPPFDYNEFDKPKGLSIDFIKLLARNVGVEINFVNGRSWSELLSMFENKKIDVIPAMYKIRTASPIHYSQNHITRESWGYSLKLVMKLPAPSKV